MGEEVILELVDGTAEIFGTELVPHRRYNFEGGHRVGVFTWHGCSLELIGVVEGLYVAKQTPMVIYVNTHAALEQMRQKAYKGRRRGPRVMIVGTARGLQKMASRRARILSPDSGSVARAGLGLRASN